MSRLLNFCPAHAEGWALYAERLMAELGFLDDPGDRLGMLDAQELRAARVVLDIGLHLDLLIPPGTAGDTRWNYDIALQPSAALDCGDHIDPVTGRDGGVGPATARHHLGVQSDRDACLPVAQLADQVGDRDSVRGLPRLTVDDYLHGAYPSLRNLAAPNGLHSGASGAFPSTAVTASAVSADSRMPLR